MSDLLDLVVHGDPASCRTAVSGTARTGVPLPLNWARPKPPGRRARLTGRRTRTLPSLVLASTDGATRRTWPL